VPSEYLAHFPVPQLAPSPLVRSNSREESYGGLGLAEFTPILVKLTLRADRASPGLEPLASQDQRRVYLEEVFDALVGCSASLLAVPRPWIDRAVTELETQIQGL
jgi:hypothetical protein